MIRHFKSVKWTKVTDDDYDGTGEHALYKIHKLSQMKTGVGKVEHVNGRSGWMTARKLGDNPFKVVGGPYPTAEAAQVRAESLESGL